MNIVFFGNWGLANMVLQRIASVDDIDILCVVTQCEQDTDDFYFNCVRHTARSLGLRVFDNYNLIPKKTLNDADLGLSVSYSEIFRSDVLSKIRILNVHPSKLPLFRGPTPIQWQIRCGEKRIGATIHFIDDKIDEGDIYAQEEFEIDYSSSYNNAVDDLNIKLSTWVSAIVAEYTSSADESLKPVETGTRYYHRIEIPDILKTRELVEVNSYLNRRRLAIFTGNRAEFGIVLPLIERLAEHYYIDLILSGAHTQEPWMTKDEVYTSIQEREIPINVLEVVSKVSKNYYRDSFNINFNYGMNYLKKFTVTYPVEMVIVLGDRVETYGFANASFFSQVPVCHLFGGDISNVPYFDTNIRHAITKISNLHFTSNRQSHDNLLRMGEEDWRCFTMGNISLDNYTNGNTSSKEYILSKYSLRDEKVIILTYHPSQFVSVSDNFRNFMLIYKKLRKIPTQVVITFPNNDEGHQDITTFLEAHPKILENVLVVKSLGIKDYLGMLKEFDCVVVGNSSSGLFETAFTGTPSINIGDRQTDRPRARNVIDMSVDDVDTTLQNALLEIIDNYEIIKENNIKEYDFFGVGNSVGIVLDGIELFLGKSRLQQIFKKFVVHA